MKKINVVGTSGSGKTTFSRALAQRLNVPCIEMDALFWKPGWTQSTDDEFFAKLAEALDCDTWVLDGNYSRTTAIKWKDVDTIIWVDFGFARTMWQAVKRAVLRVRDQRELWPGSGNRENLRMLFSRDSILLWTLKTYRVNKKRYRALIQNPQYAHLRCVRLRSPTQCQTFLAECSP